MRSVEELTLHHIEKLWQTEASSFLALGPTSFAIRSTTIARPSAVYYPIADDSDKSLRTSLFTLRPLFAEAPENVHVGWIISVLPVFIRPGFRHILARRRQVDVKGIITDRPQREWLKPRLMVAQRDVLVYEVEDIAGLVIPALIAEVKV